MKVHAPTKNQHFVVIDVRCDSCGESCKTEKGFRFMTLHGKWADVKLTAQICEKCVNEKLYFVDFKKETWDTSNTTLETNNN